MSEPITFVCDGLAIIGNIVVVAATNTGARYFAMFLMPIGALPAIQIIIAWLANTLPRPAAKRSAAIAAANVVSNSCNIWSSYLYPTTNGPRYSIGGGTLAGMAVLVCMLTVIMRLCLQRENKKLDAAANIDTIPEGEKWTTLGVVAKEDIESARKKGFRYIL